MSIQTLIRPIVLCLAAFASGCSVIGGPEPGSDLGTVRSDQCRWDRSSCIYEGRYEAGERDYAEQEAARLNRAASARLRAHR